MVTYLQRWYCHLHKIYGSNVAVIAGLSSSSCSNIRKSLEVVIRKKNSRNCCKSMYYKILYHIKWKKKKKQFCFLNEAFLSAECKGRNWNF